MECTRCEKELNKNEVTHDYMGNEWCLKCMDEELNRKADEHFQPFEDFEKAKSDSVNAIDKTFRITKFASWLEPKLNKILMKLSLKG